MQSSHLIAYTPPGFADPALAIAACRAGARGILDLEYTQDVAAALAALNELAHFTTTAFGIKLGPRSCELAAQLSSATNPRLRWIVLAGGAHQDLAGWVKQFQQQGKQVYLEAVSLEEARLGESLGVDGLILKGHEAGGRVGAETSFVLLQRWQAHKIKHSTTLPVWIQGGVGLHTVAACVVGGAAGVVLDAQLLLTRESPLDHESRQRLLAFDGSETLCLGERLGASYRCFHRPRWGAGDEMIQEEERIAAAELSDAEKKEAWCTAVAKLVGNSPDRHLWLIGQDAAFARSLAERHGTVAGVIQALVEQGQRQLKTARRLQPLAEGAPLAVRHKTRYPIVQGPMTRVSDTAAFAESVAAAGGLPFLALALMRQNEATKLLQEAKTRLQGKSWGVGILGFVPPEIRSEQLTAIRQYPPPFALIAGGQPAQARELENEGITTYLHVPSPGLLKMFLKEGARRFVFEGRECGGHVGPRTSFVLWETMCQLLLDHLGPHSRGDDLHIIFAGGIHDALSSAMVAALAAPLAERGVAVGVLMGTAYLFTQEAVASGGIVARFQQEALNCGDTVLLQTGPGHAIRCIRTPYQDLFETEKRRLQQEGRSHEEITRTLEWMNIGRLRIASKGIDRARNADSPTKFVTLAADEQHQRGMYMIGQVAALRDRVISMQELHADVSVGGTQFLQSQAEPSLEVVETPKAQPCDVAVIGMACFYPRAADVWSYWENVLSKVDAVTEVPASHWDWRLYYDSNPQAADKIISKWGGFLDDMTFDPMAFGITPKSITAIEPLQLFLLEGVRRALIDAGYDKRPFNRERTATILGIGGGGSPLAVSYGLRTCIPMFDTVPGLAVDADEIFKKTAVMLPEWTEDSFPGILLNVAVGRVANRFDFGGPNYAIDAACGSSLASLQACIRELEVGTSDVAVAMGADTVQTPYAYMAFSKTHALSPKGRCKPFDAAADGIVLSEGIGVVVLKRLADAERDGDKIYAVIKGMGASSDGRDKGLTAPRAKGQLLALRRAYEKAGISPACVELIEAHGTGTVVGDQTEVQALGQVLAESGAEPHSCALGSVKSMIGHSKCAAGIAGFIKTVMAIQHKVLPPTLVEKPNLKYDWEKGPLYLNTEPRPWVHGPESPRVAGVSAFGFGGTNFHVVLEEYTGSYLPPEESAMRHWPAELLLFRKPSRAALLEAVERCHRALVQGAAPQLADLALSLYKDAAADAAAPTLAVVASHVEDVQAKLEQALKTLRSSDKTLHDPRGIYFAEQPAQQSGKVAFLFPGQGSQYPDMLAQTAIAFAEVRQALDRAEDILAGTLEKPLSRFIYPSSAFTPQRQKENQQALTRTDVAQPAIGAVSMGMYQLLSRFGLQPDFLAGHSYGEYVALWAAGVMDEEQLLRLSYQRGKIIREAAGSMPGGMVAVEAEAAAVEGVLGGLADVVIANRNAPAQTVISGTEAALTAALKRCQEQGLRAQRIPVACGFHSPLVESARQPLAQAIVASTFAAPARPVFANSTAQPYPAEPAAIAALLAQHLVSSVHFQAEIEAMYDAGARIFVEVGPHGVLTGLVHQILSKRPHLALSSDVKGRPGLLHLQHLLAQLLVHGVPVQLARLYQGRALKTHNLNRLKEETTPPAPTPTTWLVNSIRSRPWNAPEPRLIGQQRVAASKPTPPAAKPAAKSETPPSTAARPVLAQPVAPVHRPIPENRRSFTSMQPLSTSPATNGVKPAANGVYLPQDEAAQVMLRFQDLMAKFLDTQKAVMTTYLQGGGEPAGLSNGTAHAPLPVQVPPVRSNGSVGHNGNGHSSPAAARGEMVPAPVATPPGREIVVKPESSANGTTASAPVESKKEPEKKQELTVQMDRGWLSNQLLELVGERTGYPREMLGVDMDLEADLGIDSIKRIEILGALAELMGLGTEAGADSGLEMEKLTTIRTLRGILDYLEGTLSEKKKSASPAASLNGEAHPAPAASLNGEAHPAAAVTSPAELDIQRALVRLIEAPLPALPSPALPSGAILFTDDGRGIARELAGRLADFGQNCVLLRMGEQVRSVAAEVYEANLSDPDSVQAVLDSIRTEVGTIGGLVHLLPLAEPPAAETPLQRMDREVKSLYLLARELGDELRQSGKTGGAFLLSVTGMGGGLAFGNEALPATFFAGHGGVVGFTKCIAYEWPEVLVRVVDVDGTKPAVELAERLADELGDPKGPIEVGYLKGKRVTWEPYAAPLETAPRVSDERRNGDPLSSALVPGARGVRSEGENNLTADLLTPDATVLITGGARGITAVVALELARRYQPNLILVGRSALPADHEAEDTAGLTRTADIKAALIARSQREGQEATPAAIEAAYKRLLQDREIRQNLQRIRAAGARVQYYSVDVRDEQALARLLEEIEQKHGALAGVIHGAGVIEDRLLRDKTPASFDRVFRTKIASALLLSQRLRPEKLKFCVFFSSIASRYGNKGQSDYAAANEVLSKMAWELDRRWPCRVFSIAWGPWASIGMVAELEKHLTQRGLKLISPEAGPVFVAEDLLYGRKGESEVIIAGGAEHVAEPARTEKVAAAAALSQ